MNVPGISDSIASIAEEMPACPSCGSAARVNGNACVSCLLQTGLDDIADLEPENFDQVLREIEIRDTDWRLGNYQIFEEIGRGGMGVIYRARQRHSKRIVALKRVLSFHGDSRETLERFRREAEAAASLDHPNILPIYEVGESDGLPFFTMKYASGGSLQQVGTALRANTRECCRLLLKVARAVAYAHREGILHRDLKPGNILLDGQNEPLVTDFGLAKWIDASSDLTRSLTIFGTPGYIAPEQASGSPEALTPAADVYSLGAILFDLLAGRPPFLGEHALAVIRQAAETAPPKLRSLVRGANRDLETICAKCLEPEALARYRSASDLADDLERWLEGRSIVARPVSPPLKLWRWSRRNPKLAASLVACFLLGGIGLIERNASSRLSSTLQEVEVARRSIAVLPFEDLDELSRTSASAEEVTAIFSRALENRDGIRFRPLHQDLRGADFWKPDEWKKLGQTLGARYLVSGSTRLRDGKRHVALRVIESATGAAVESWVGDAETHAGATDAFVMAVQALLGKAQANASSGTRSIRDGDAAVESVGGSDNGLARSYCASGEELLFRYNLTDLLRAIDSFRKAVALDPNYASAHAWLASACQARAQIDPAGHWLDEADASAATALRIAPLLPEAHRARAGILRRRGQLRASVEPCITAYELDPAEGRTAAMLADVTEQIGRPDLSIGWCEKAMSRQSRPFFADNLGNAWTMLGEFEEAAKAYHTAAIFRPDLPVGSLGLIRLDLFQRNFDKAREGCAQARAKYPDNPEPLVMAALVEFYSRNFVAAEKLFHEAQASNHDGGVNFTGSVRFLSAIGFIQKLSDSTRANGETVLQEARSVDEKELLAAPDNLRRLYSLAATCAAQGDAAAAVTYLAKAIEAGWIDIQSPAFDPRFDSIRDSQAFRDILAQLKTKVQEMGRRRSGRMLAASSN